MRKTTADKAKQPKQVAMGRWVPLPLFPYQWPSVGGLRLIIREAGLRGEVLPWVRRLGRRVLVSPELFDAWVASQPTGHAAPSTK